MLSTIRQPKPTNKLFLVIYFMQCLCPSIPNIKLCFSLVPQNASTCIFFEQCCFLFFSGNNATGELKKALDNHKDTILFIAWNSNDAFLITGSGSSDNRVVVWDTNRWESMQEVAFDSGAS